MLSAILFDLDGTLVNSDPLHFQIWKEILNRFDVTIDEEFYRQKISGRTNLQLIQDLLPQLSETEARQLGEEKEAHFRDIAWQLQPLSGLPRFLEWIDEKNLKRAVVTNAPRQNAEFFLEKLQLQDYFPIVILAEDLAHGKPHPAPYQEALRRLAVPVKDAIAFEDSPSGIRSAVAADLWTIGVASTHPPDVLRELGAKKVINDFNDPDLWEYLN